MNSGIRNKEQFRATSYAHRKSSPFWEGLGAFQNGLLNASLSFDREKEQQEADIGVKLAIQSLAELKKAEEEFARAKNYQGDDFDSDTAYNYMDAFTVTKLVEIRDRFGENSKTYQSYEKAFLLPATKTTEENKTSYEQFQMGKAQRQAVKDIFSVVQTSVPTLNTEAFINLQDTAYASGYTFEQASSLFTNASLGYLGKTELDLTRLYKNGKLDPAANQAYFAEFFSGIASIDKKGNVKEVGGMLTQEDAAKLKRAWDAAVKMTGDGSGSFDWYPTINNDRNIVANKNGVPFLNHQDVQDFTDARLRNIDAGINFAVQTGAVKTIEDVPDTVRKTRDDAIREDNELHWQVSVGEQLANKLGTNNSQVASIYANGYVDGKKIDKGRTDPILAQGLQQKYGEPLARNIDMFMAGDTSKKNMIVSQLKTLNEMEQTLGVTTPLTSTLRNNVIIKTGEGYSNLNQKFKMAKLMKTTGTIYSDGASGSLLNSATYQKVENILSKAQGIIDPEQRDKFVVDEFLRQNTSNIYTIEQQKTNDITDTSIQNMFFSKEGQDYAIGQLNFFGTWGESISSSAYVTNSIQPLASAVQSLAAISGISFNSKLGADHPDNEAFNNMFKENSIEVSWGDTRSILLKPTVVDDNGALTPLKNREFVNGVQNIFKNKGYSNLDWDNYDRVKYDLKADRNSGILMTIYVDGDYIGTFNGNDIKTSFINRNTSTIVNNAEDKYQQWVKKTGSIE